MKKISLSMKYINDKSQTYRINKIKLMVTLIYKYSYQRKKLIFTLSIINYRKNN